jgi:glycosyltransferase involved in cell wall biosynthesis
MLLDTLALVPQLPKADVYHSLTAGMGGLIGSMAKVLHASPLVVAEHGLYLKERNIDLSRQDLSATARQQLMTGYKTMVKTSHQYADLLVPICRSHAEAALALGASPDKIRIVTNGIDCDKFTPPPSKNGAAPVVGCFARVVPVKDIINLIRASKKVLEKQVAHFVVIGEIQDDEYYKQCQALVQEFGLTKNVSFIGHVDKVLEWYHKVDVFALCSQSEGVPLALLEAMSCGLPSVCTAVGGVPDILSDATAGYIVPPSDPDSLASKLCELLENQKLRRKMGSQARELVREKYTIESMAHKILGVYLEVLL